MIINDDNGYSSEQAPDQMLTAFNEINSNREAINGIAIRSAAEWAFIRGGNGNWRSGIPEAMSEALQDINRNGKAVSCIAFAPNNGWVVIEKKGQ